MEAEALRRGAAAADEVDRDDAFTSSDLNTQDGQRCNTLSLS